MERFRPTDLLPDVKNVGIYEVKADSRNNLWMAEYTEGHLGKIDAKTKEVTWYDMPTAHARARRLEIDDQDRVLVAEYRTSKAALFDSKTKHSPNTPCRNTHSRTGPISTGTVKSGPPR